MDYISIPKTSKFRKWSKYFFDVKIYFKKLINVDKYTSGSVYKAFNIKTSKKINIHNSLWDSYSIYITLNHVYKKKMIN